MKRSISLTLALALALCGCTGQPQATKTPEEYTQSYQAAITAARSAEENDAIAIVTDPEDSLAELLFSMLGLTAEDMSAYALSISPMNIRAYGLALAMPASGREDAVRQGFESFVENQKQSFKNYLEDQYAVAQAAQVETLEDGTVILVMCEEQDKVLEDIKKSLLA